MEFPVMFTDPTLKPILCVEMHTTGEPTRSIYKGFPELSGTLFEQRSQAKRDFDHVRTRLMLEPRGHFDMYGSLLRPQTELTKSGEAHMGVLFMTNDGFSTMCGHATIALGRFLVDTHDPRVFPKREELVHDPKTNTILLNLHAPCGLIKVTIPSTPDGTQADPLRPVSFESVPSFTTAIDKSYFRLFPYFSYGGAFYCIISATELGFPQGLPVIDLDATNKATRLLKAAIIAKPQLRSVFHHPDQEDLGFLYSVIIVDDTLGVPDPGTKGSETGLCYFADQQIDRSLTGSGVAVRIALAHARAKLRIGESWTYHSLVSNAFAGNGSFTGCITSIENEVIDVNGHPSPSVRVRVEGFAYYTGFHSFVEDVDPIGEQGFTFNRLSV